jgi:hypothetical protein
MTEAWIIDAARTPRGIGKPGKGRLTEVHPQPNQGVCADVIATLEGITREQTEPPDRRDGRHAHWHVARRIGTP